MHDFYRLALPLVICFAVGALFAFLDLHRFITKGGGTSSMSYFKSFHAYVFCSSISLISVVCFLTSIFVKGSWIDKALALETDNDYFRSVVIAMSTTILIKSKLFELKDGNFGLEYPYDLLRGWAANGYKSKAAAKRIKYANTWGQTTKIDNLFEGNLIAAVTSAIDHRDEADREKIANQFKTIAASSSKQSDPSNYNSKLILISIDAIGLSALNTLMKEICDTNIEPKKSFREKFVSWIKSVWIQSR